VPRITDEQMITAVAHLEHRSFTVLEVQPDGGDSMRLRFLIADEPGTFAVRLPLPSTHQLKPWLFAIPDDAAHAATMLAGFLAEEVDAGCAHWASTTREGADRVFLLEPYGFRPADRTGHRHLAERAGPPGCWGWIQENDDRHATPGGREHARLAGLPFTYPQIGASAGDLPPGYRHIDVERHLGTGPDRYQLAVARLMTWDMHRRAGLLVDFAGPTVTAGQVAVVSFLLGPVPIAAPVRVVEVVTEATVQGFAYGTLPGHPESGEERFLVHHDPGGAVRATVRAFSRPARWYTRVGAPLARRIQDRTTDHYLDALAAPV
jgi:uncharacterized protein (UPF0548 family)